MSKVNSDVVSLIFDSLRDPYLRRRYFEIEKDVSQIAEFCFQKNSKGKELDSFDRKGWVVEVGLTLDHIFSDLYEKKNVFMGSRYDGNRKTSLYWMKREWVNKKLPIEKRRDSLILGDPTMVYVCCELENCTLKNCKIRQMSKDWYKDLVNCRRNEALSNELFVGKVFVNCSFHNCVVDYMTCDFMNEDGNDQS